MLIRGAVVDLDDTLYDQQTWLLGAWSAVADAAPVHVERAALRDALVTIAADGSDQGRIIDRALDAIGASDVAIEELVLAFRAHAPATLPLYPGVNDALRRLRSRMPVALVTDGDPTIQRAKLAALDLRDEFDAIVFSDELGRDRRKPHPMPFLVAASSIGVEPNECVFVGDRPDKDLRGSKAAGYAGAVRVLTGEYRESPSTPCLATVMDFVAAVEWIECSRSGVAQVPGSRS